MIRARRLLLPALVFAAVLVTHFVWRGVHPECAAGEEACTEECQPDTTWFGGYLDAGNHWLGLSYAASAAYAVGALRRAFERRTTAARAGAARGLAFSAVLPFVGCWLVGCCGSPMLAVYLNLLGASFLPFAKPLVAGLTGTVLLLSWAWTRRKGAAQSGGSCAPSPDCGC